jgi:aminoglycoside phosphotransferase (APT) family kinase protein
MDQDHIAESPAACRETLHSALRAAFGSMKIDKIVPISGGVSGAFPFRVEIGDRRYVVRVEGPATPLRNPHQYDSMLIAAEAGIAPKVHYIDESSRVVVMDFIEARSIRSIPGGSQGLVQALGESLRSLQATRPFQRFIAYPDIVDRLWQWVCQTGLFAPGVLDPYTERLARIRETYIWEPADLVSSHNDPVPLNILFDGDRLWLIDWEIAYRNDPLVDVAIILDNLAPSPELESLLLKTWLGREPEDELRAQLVQVRALTRLFYTGVLFSASAAASGAMADDDLSAMTIAEFRQAIRDGQLQPYSLPTRHVLGKMYLASFLAGTVPPALWPADWQNGS